MTEARTETIVLSAGGTGGHVFPAAALSRVLMAQGYAVAVISDVRGRRYEDSFSGAPFYVIRAGTPGGGPLGLVRGLVSLVVGTVQSFVILRRLRPVAVVGFGGYPSVPAVWAAQRMNIPTVIHEQNAVMGRANQFLAPRCARVALSLPPPDGVILTAGHIVTGNPVREDITVLHGRDYAPPGQAGSINILVMGGSLGAKIFSDIVPSALARMPESLRCRLEVVQQCRTEDKEAVIAAYRAAGIRARVETFLNDVPDLLASAHLVISRSGASTVAEVAVAGRPAIFVPYPHHKDQQQRVNAQTLSSAGAAILFDEKVLSVEDMNRALAKLLGDTARLSVMARAAHGVGRPDAARRLAEVVQNVVEKN